MGREVRMVPADWQHPKDSKGNYIPMFDTSYEDAVRDWETEDLPEWIEGAKLWATGFVKSVGEVIPISKAIEDAKARRSYAPPPDDPTYEWWAGDVPRKPVPEDYMPDWPEAERTHWMMYEDTSEGTPISPAFATPEELARWLADNGASSFGDMTATYEQWLATCKGAWGPSMVMTGGKMMSGVEFAATREMP